VDAPVSALVGVTEGGDTVRGVNLEHLDRFWLSERLTEPQQHRAQIEGEAVRAQHIVQQWVLIGPQLCSVYE